MSNKIIHDKYPQNSNTNGVPSTEIRLTDQDGNWRPTWTAIPTMANPFCGGHSQLEDGTILVAGGDSRSDTGLLDGRRYVRTYNNCTSANCTGSWTESYQMSVERWYPTVVTLYDGR